MIIANSALHASLAISYPMRVRGIIVLYIYILLYGYFHPCKFKTITNFTLLAAKYFIYRCFLNEEPLDFELYKLLVCEKILTEQLIASKIIITIIYHPFSYFYYFQF